jgi:parallel beta-helix repeat protein
MKSIFSTFMVALILAATLVVAFDVRPVRASGTIYIRADGSIDPPTAPLVTLDSVTYTLTGNVTSDASGIVVERDNIVLDGAGYTLQGPLAFLSRGIDLSDRTNVTVRNTHIKNYMDGIWLLRSSNVDIADNTVADNGVGIKLDPLSSYNSIAGNTITANNDGIRLHLYSSNNNITSNTLADNHRYSILLEFFSSYNNIIGNTVANSLEGIRLDSSNHNIVSGNTFTNDGLMVWNSSQNVVENNTVNGKPLVYLEEVANYTVADAGQVILINCTDIRVEHLNLSRTSIGAQLWQTRNSSIAGNVVANNWCGIRLDSSSNNSISGNTIADNSNYGIQLASSSNVSISGNTITANGLEGIRLDSSNHNSIAGNTITVNDHEAIRLGFSSNVSITSNTLADNLVGIYLDSSSSINISGNNMARNNGGVGLSHTHNTTVSKNTIASSWAYGVWLDEASFNAITGNNITNGLNFGLYLEGSSSDNVICHNNFINNNLHTLLISAEYVNSWDNGYPDGGNYWSGYTDEDSFKGPQQNATGRDGVWDHPHIIDADNHDRYPLTTPLGWFPVGNVDGDQDVDIFDIVQMAGVYGLDYPDPRYDRLCDVDLDGDIDIFDIVRAAGNYGQSW